MNLILVTRCCSRSTLGLEGAHVLISYADSPNIPDEPTSFLTPSKGATGLSNEDEITLPVGVDEWGFVIVTRIAIIFVLNYI